MPLVNRLLAALWVAFVIYWIAMALRAKRSVGRSYSAGAIVIRVVITVGAVGLLSMRHRVPWPRQFGVRDPDVASIGLLVVLAGLAFAVWARVYIGRNWGPPMTQRAEPELVTGGPYAYVRHPIYTGILLAMLGSALVQGPAWLVVSAVSAAYFVFSARAEESLMTRLFPDAYPAYQRRTAMLLPFVF